MSFLDSTSREQQRGVALAVALLLLIIVTLLGLAAIRGTTVQQRMTTNFYDRQLSFQNAEAALRAAEALLDPSSHTTLTASDFYDCRPDATPANNCTVNPFDDVAAVTALTKTVSTSAFPAGANAPGQPQYIIQLMCRGAACAPNSNTVDFSQSAGVAAYGNPDTTTSPDRAYFRITARGCGPDPDQPSADLCTNRSGVILQVMYEGDPASLPAPAP